MLGCDLPSSPPETLELLTNADLLDVLRASRNNRELLRDGDLVVWAAESTTTADRFAAVFNTGGGTLEAALPRGGRPARGCRLWRRFLCSRFACSGFTWRRSAVCGAPARGPVLPLHGKVGTAGAGPSVVVPDAQNGDAALSAAP
jgi:hypothetical protein